MSERRNGDLRDYDIQIAAEIVAGTQWAWTGERLQSADDGLNKEVVVKQAEKLIKESRKKWKNFTDSMNA